MLDLCVFISPAFLGGDGHKSYRQSFRRMGRPYKYLEPSYYVAVQAYSFERLFPKDPLYRTDRTKAADRLPLWKR